MQTQLRTSPFPETTKLSQNFESRMDFHVLTIRNEIFFQWENMYFTNLLLLVIKNTYIQD